MYLHISSTPPTVTNTAVVLELRSSSRFLHIKRSLLLFRLLRKVLSTVQDSPLSICMPLALGNSLVSPEIQAALKSQSYMYVSVS